MRKETTKKVLVTGASGLLGRRLVELLNDKGYEVHTVGREATYKPGSRNFYWNIESGELQKGALDGVTAIIHLAGAGIAEARWSNVRKQEIIDSRVKSAKLLFKVLKVNKREVKTFISASAVGFYGDCGSEIISEEHKPGKDFLSEVCQKWENAAIHFTKLGIREVRCRIGIVLAKGGGALPELTKTMPLGVAGYFTKSPLYYPWIHIDDVCGILIHVLENDRMRGAYNATAPAPVLMEKLMEEIVRVKESKALVVPVPPLTVRVALGEMSEMVLSSQRCSAAKILAAGYQFKYPEVGEALKAVV